MSHVSVAPPAGGGHNHRWVPLEGAYNVRDVGGLPTMDSHHVRTGRIFRGDSLDGCTAADVAVLNVLGIRHLIDLRNKDRGNRPLGPHVGRTFLPVAQDLRSLSAVANDSHGGGLISLYLESLDEGRMHIGRVLTTIADNCHKALAFHCTAGKDRTGIVTALLLLLLGVAEDLVVEDYALTDDRIGPIHDQLRGSNYGVELVQPEMFRARPETMRATLDGLRERFGTAENWATHSGLSAANVARLRAELLVTGAAGGTRS